MPQHTMAYNDPINGDPSSIGDEQFREFYYQKKALFEMRKEQFFGQTANTQNLPK